ncbi:kinesin heavy chain [Stagonosporopsis vannaccii]|nr:kinesin heavy chain [Stagonosporopsis vannaccii]
MHENQYDKAATVARMRETCTYLREMQIEIQRYKDRETMFRQKIKDQQKLLTQYTEDMEQLRAEKAAAEHEAKLLQEHSDQYDLKFTQLNNEVTRVRSDANLQVDQINKDLLRVQKDNELQLHRLEEELKIAHKHSEAQASQFKEEVSTIRQDAEVKISQMEKTYREQVATRVAHERSDSATLLTVHRQSMLNRQLKQQVHKITNQALCEHGKWSSQVRMCTDLETKVRLEREAVENVAERYRQDYGSYEELPPCKMCSDMRLQVSGVDLKWKELLSDIAEMEKDLYNESLQLTGIKFADLGATLERLAGEATRFMDVYHFHLEACLSGLQQSRCCAFYNLVKQRGGILSLARPRKPEGGQLAPGLRFDSAGKTVYIAEESRSSLNPKVTMRPYVFDAVLHPSDSNEILWADHIQPLIENSFCGLDVTLLAYGQTGSGKTYTMCEKATSIIAKTIERVFERVDCPETLPKPCELRKTTHVELPDEPIRRPEYGSSDANKPFCTRGTRYRVNMSVIEIYRNKPYTLVGDRVQIEFRIERNESGLDQYKPYYYDKKSDRVAGIVVNNKEECMEVFEDAMRRRSRRDMTLHGSGLNSESSRSHMVCTLRLESTDQETRRTESYIQLVDLAGSERIVTTVANPNQKKEMEEAKEEGRAITTSLSNLLDLLKNLRTGNSIKKTTWTSSMINIALHPGLSRPSPLIAFMACMRTEVPGVGPKAPAAVKQKEEKAFIDKVRSTCREGSRLIVHEECAGTRSRATSATECWPETSNRRAE